MNPQSFSVPLTETKMPVDDEYLSIPEFARHCAISWKRASDAILQQKVDAVRIAGRWVVRRESAEQYARTLAAMARDAAALTSGRAAHTRGAA
jgi:hypothetical protein